MPKRKRSITDNSNKYNQRLRRQQESYQQAANRRFLDAQREKDNSNRIKKHWAKEDFSLPNGSEREAGKREYEIGERKLVDAVSHAQQTKNDVYS